MNRFTEASQFMGRGVSICYLLFHYIQIVIIIAIFLILILDAFYGEVQFLKSFNARLCVVCNENIFSYVRLSLLIKNILLEGLGKNKMLSYFFIQCLLSDVDWQTPRTLLGWSNPTQFLGPQNNISFQPRLRVNVSVSHSRNVMYGNHLFNLTITTAGYKILPC